MSTTTTGFRRGIPPPSKWQALAEIRSRLDGEAFVRDVLGVHDYVRRRSELVMHCVLPFGLHSHGDRNPSASFNDEKLVYNCFTCGGGDVLWLVQAVQGVDLDGALRVLKGQIEPGDVSLSELQRQIDKLWAGDGAGYVMPTFGERILRPWECFAKFLDDRGISREVQRRMRTGVDLKSREQIGEDVWIEQPRLVIPHFFGGKLRGWQKRRLDDRIQVGPKYLSSPSFPKDRTLYNLDNVEGPHAIVVESPTTVLHALSEGVDPIVGTFGKSVTDTQVALLERFERVTMFFDADAAGRRGTLSVAGRLTHARVLAVPSWEIWPDRPGLDPGNLRGEEIEDAVAMAVPPTVLGRDDEEVRRDRRVPQEARSAHGEGGRRRRGRRKRR